MNNRMARTQLWRGFLIMGLAVLIWVLCPNLEVGETRFPIGTGLGALVFLGGAIVTAMGLIQYAADVRKRG